VENLELNYNEYKGCTNCNQIDSAGHITTMMTVEEALIFVTQEKLKAH